MSLKGEKTKQDIREKAYQLFAEKGVRMYSKLMKMDSDIPTQITCEIKKLLLPEEVPYGK